METTITFATLTGTSEEIAKAEMIRSTFIEKIQAQTATASRMMTLRKAAQMQIIVDALLPKVARVENAAFFITNQRAMLSLALNKIVPALHNVGII